MASTSEGTPTEIDGGFGGIVTTVAPTSSID